MSKSFSFSKVMIQVFLIFMFFLSWNTARAVPFCGYEFGIGSTVGNEVEINQIPYSQFIHIGARGLGEAFPVNNALTSNSCYQGTAPNNCIIPSCYTAVTNSLFPNTSAYISEKNFTNLRICGNGTNNLCPAEIPWANDTAANDFTYNRSLTNISQNDIVRAFVYIHNNATEVSNPGDAPATFAYRTAQNLTLHLDWDTPGNINSSITWDLNNSRGSSNTSTNNTLSLANTNLRLEPIRIQWMNPITGNYITTSGIAPGQIENGGNALTSNSNSQLLVSGNSLSLLLGDLHSSLSYFTGVYVDFRVVADAPNYDIVKTAYPPNGSNIGRGMDVQYRVEITNNGTTPLTTTVIDDYDEVNTTFVPDPNNPYVTDNNVTNNGNGTVSLQFTDVQPGATQELLFTVQVNTNVPDGTTFCNAVTASDGTPSEVCHTVTYDKYDELSLVKTVDPDCYTEGGNLTFSIEVSNTGTDTINDLVITDPIDPNLIVDTINDVAVVADGGADWSVEEYNNPNGGGYHQIVIENIGGDGTLSPGESHTLTFTVTVANPTDPNNVPITNQSWGNAFATGAIGDNVPVANNSNPVSVPECGGPINDYTIEKTGEIYDYIGDNIGQDSGLWEPSVLPGNPTVYRGDLIRYTLTATNNLGTAQTIYIPDELPIDSNDNDGDGDITEPLVTYIPPTLPTGITANYNATPDPHTLDVVFTDVPAGASRSFTFYVEVIPVQTLNPDGSILCNNIPGFPQEQVCSEVFGDVDPDFVLTKANDPADCVISGDTITYTITVQNNHTVGNMTNIVITDDLNNNVTSSNNPVILNFADLAPGDTSPPQTITATVNAGVPVGAVISNVANGVATWNGQIVNHSNIVYNTVQANCSGGNDEGDGSGSATIFPTAGICALNQYDQVICQRIAVSDKAVANSGLRVLDSEGNILFPYLDANIAELDPIKADAKKAALECNKMSDGPDKRECVNNWIGRFLGGIACGYPSMVVNGEIIDPRPLLDTDGWTQVFENPYNKNSQYQGIPAEDILDTQCAGVENIIKEVPCDSMNGSAFFADIKKGVYENNDDALPMPADTLADKVYKPNNQIVDYEVEVTLGYNAYKNSTPENRIIIKKGVITIYDYTVPAESIQNEWNRTLMTAGEWNYTGGQQFDYDLMDDLNVLNQKNGGVITPTLRYSMNPKLAIQADQGTLKNIAFAVVETTLQPQVLIDGVWNDNGDVIESTYGIGNDLMCMDGIPVTEDTITNSTDSNNAFVEIIRPYLQTAGGSNLGLYETTTDNNENLFGQIGDRKKEEGFFTAEDLQGKGIGTLNEINDGNGQDFIENLKQAALNSGGTESFLGKDWQTTADEMEIYFTTGNVSIDSTSFINQGKLNGSPIKTLVIDGDLTINGDIALLPKQYLAFIVNGDITIGKEVKQLDGIYIAQSTADGTAGGNINSDDISNEQLVVNGSLIGNIENLAKNRIYIGTPEDDGVLEPSIILSYDLRVLNLTPPAIEQFLGEGWGQEGQ